jgi:hypothetical protein
VATARRASERDRGLAREQARELEFAVAEVGLLAAHPAHVERARDLAADEERHDDQRLGLLGCAGDGARARIGKHIVHAFGGAVGDHPAGDPTIDRERGLFDQGCKSIARQNRAQKAFDPIHPIDRQVVVSHHGLERIRDEVEHALRIERRKEALVDLEQPALACERPPGLLVGPPPAVADPPQNAVGEGQHDRGLGQRQDHVGGLGGLRGARARVPDRFAEHARPEGEDQQDQERPPAFGREREHGARERQDDGGVDAVRQECPCSDAERHEHDPGGQQIAVREAARDEPDGDEDRDDEQPGDYELFRAPGLRGPHGVDDIEHDRRRGAQGREAREPAVVTRSEGSRSGRDRISHRTRS